MNTYFILSLVSLLAAVTIVALKVCYASKCEKVRFCWGILEVEREVSLENKELSERSYKITSTDAITQMNISQTNLNQEQYSV